MRWFIFVIKSNEIMKKTSIIFTLFIIVSLAIYLPSCATDKLPEPTVGAECDEFVATYDGDVKAIIDATCAITGCHVSGGGAPGNYETYAGLVPYANNGPNGLRDRVIVLVNDPNSGMPPNWDTNPGPKDLTDEQFTIFKCWVDSGYPEN